MNRRQALAFAVLTTAVVAAFCSSPPAAGNPLGTSRTSALHGGIDDVAIISPHLAWAVGGARRDENGSTLLAERWDGTTWTRVDVPVEPGSNAGFVKVAASSPSDVWAVGVYSKGSALLSFADHWDGSTWTKVPIPNVHRLPFVSDLSGLSVVSPTDAWASGYAGSPHPWVLHWDGASWTRVPCPNFAGRWNTTVWGVAAFSDRDAWIVGTTGTGTGAGDTFAAHWDGTRWTRARTPSVPHMLNVPWSVGASSRDNIWAAGYEINIHTRAGGPLVMHWNGTRWHLASLPPPGRGAQFYNIATSSPTDAWAVGDNNKGALAMHWDGTAWTIASPSAQSAVGIGDFSPDLAIVGGSFADGTVLHETWDGSGWH